MNKKEEELRLPQSQVVAKIPTSNSIGSSSVPFKEIDEWDTLPEVSSGEMTKTPKLKTSKTDIPETKSIDNQMQKEIQQNNHASLSKSKTTTSVGNINQQPNEKSQNNIAQKQNPFEGLDDESPLAEILGQDLIQREEFEFIQDIVNKNGRSPQGEFNVHSKLVFYSNTSLWLLDSKNQVRKAIVWLIEWRQVNLIVQNQIQILSIFHHHQHSWQFGLPFPF